MRKSKYLTAALIVVAILYYIAVTLISVFFSGDQMSTHNVRHLLSEIGGDESKVKLDEVLIRGDLSQQSSKKGQERKDSADGDDNKEAAVSENTVAEAEPEPEPEITIIPEEKEKHYYSFKAVTKKTKLHMREKPNINSKSVAKLASGATGYVLELGDEWSYVTTGKQTGYCSNEFLNFTEISEEEFPEELRSEVVQTE
ncbi:MAG: hypothetical protein K5989_05030 [Lachnospiraceae bacterium]|nr:hypothetical protein [Lachnospiraceae bacterium]